MNNVEIRDGALYFHGQKYFLFGGEVQYFRLRDRAYDPEKTWAVWEDTLDRMIRAGMNLVTTYIPWNYHEPERDKFDFSGARDLDKFLGMCASRKMLVQAKPGPYITAEWPYGPRSFGAVPYWFIERHPDSLVLEKNGKPHTHDPLGAKWGRQVTYLHPAFLERVNKWFEAVAPILLKYIHEIPCIFSVQVDNETNFFWADKYLLDHNPIAIGHYRNFLNNRYGEIEKLNEAYGADNSALRRKKKGYRNFDQVEPPKKAPGRLADENAEHIDWFEAGWAYIQAFLIELRKMWESLRIVEPDILFATNDTHSSLPFNWKLQWPRPQHKAVAGIGTLDSYPRNMPLSGALDDIPYMTPFTARLLDVYGDGYPMKKGSWVMGAEMQGGMFRVPVVWPRIKPEATARMVTQAFGHGIKAYATFVIREGFHLDDSIYHYQAPINFMGEKTARFDVLERAAKNVLARIGDRLLDSAPAESEVALIVNPDYQIPLGGVKFSSMNIWHCSYGGVFGWLTRSGYAVDIVDIKRIDDLKKYRAAVYVDPGLIEAADAQKIIDYVESGGALIHFGWPSDSDLRGKSSATHRRWLAPFSQEYFFSVKSKRRAILSGVDNQIAFQVPPPLYQWRVPDGANSFLKANLGGSLGWEKCWGAGRVFQFPFDLGAIFNTGKLYRLKETDLSALKALCRYVMNKCEVKSTVDCDNGKVEAWPRFAPNGDAILFITNDGDAVEAGIRPGPNWKIDPKSKYKIFSAWSDIDFGIVEGRKLIEDGISTSLKKYGVEMIVVSS